MTDVHVEVAEQVMHVTLDGPASLNSLTRTVLDGLDAALEQAERSTSLRALVVRGAGKAFCVGMDIDFLGECFADPIGVFLPFVRRYHEVLDRLESLPVPSIAAVNGLARAGGFELLLACDFVLAADEARAADTHREFGVVPGAGASVRAVRKLGDQRARALLLTGRWLTGAEMTRWGLALENVPLAELDEEVSRLADQLRGRSRPVTAAIKQVLGAAPDLQLAEALRLEREMFARFLESDTGRKRGLSRVRREAGTPMGGRMSAGRPVTTEWTTVNQELINTLVRMGGYTHPLFHPTAAGETAPLMGQGVLLLAGGMAERSGILHDAIALIGLSEVRFHTMVHAGRSLRLVIEEGATTSTSSGKRRTEYHWTVEDDRSARVLEATALLLRRPVEEAL